MNERSIIINLVLIFIALLGLGFYVYNLKITIHHLEKDVNKLNEKLLHKKLETERLEEALRKQNDKVMQLAIDKYKARNKLDEWKAKPVKIKYKTITKVIKEPSNECEDIKSQLDAVKLIHIDDL